jgi:hypothetical protein
MRFASRFGYSSEKPLNVSLPKVGRSDLHGYVIVSAEPAADEPGRHAVRLGPGGEESAQIFEHLHKLATDTKPKPRARRAAARKGKGNRGGNRKKRRR